MSEKYKKSSWINRALGAFEGYITGTIIGFIPAISILLLEKKIPRIKSINESLKKADGFTISDKIINGSAVVGAVIGYGQSIENENSNESLQEEPSSKDPKFVSMVSKDKIDLTKTNTLH